MHELYALALALVPDQDAAGDIFLAARNEADLRRRAARWRERHGYGPLPPSPVVPDLSEAQVEHARHLGVRSLRRRRLMIWLGGAAAALALLLTAILAWRPPAPTGLAADRTFAGRSIAATQIRDGLKFEVFKAEATPAAVTVWWSLSGSGAPQRLDALPRQLSLGVTNWSEPDQTETLVSRPDRVLGRYTYRMFTPADRDRVYLRTLENGLPLTRALPVARTISINRSTSTGFGPDGSWLLLHSVGISPQFSVLRLSGEPGPDSPFVALGLLMPLGRWPDPSLPAGEYLLIFPPLPSGSRLITLEMGAHKANSQPLSVQAFKPADLGQGWEIGEWRRNGTRLEVTFTAMDTYWLTDKAVLFDWAGGKMAVLTVEYLGRSADRRRQWRISHPDLPPLDEQHTQLEIELIPQESPPVILETYLEEL